MTRLVQQARRVCHGLQTGEILYGGLITGNLGGNPSLVIVHRVSSTALGSEFIFSKNRSGIKVALLCNSSKITDTHVTR